MEEKIKELLLELATSYINDNSAEYIIGYDRDDVDGRTVREDWVIDSKTLGNVVYDYLLSLIDSGEFLVEYIAEMCGLSESEYFGITDGNDVALIKKYNDMAYKILDEIDFKSLAESI